MGRSTWADQRGPKIIIARTSSVADDRFAEPVRRVMWEIDEADPSRFRCHVGRKMSLALDENLHRKAMRGMT
jgi:hypothetical protein